MKQKIDELIEKLYDWYCIYENRAFKNPDLEIDIACEKNILDMTIVNNNGIIDELCLRFAKGQETIYDYVSIVLE